MQKKCQATFRHPQDKIVKLKNNNECKFNLSLLFIPNNFSCGTLWHYCL